jgi:hypothetical protein
MRTFVGHGAKFVGRQTIEHMIRPNLMSDPMTERQQRECQTDLQKRLEGLRLIHKVVLHPGGLLLYVELNMCNKMQRVSTLRKVLAALEAMKLHDPTEGLDSHVAGLE